MYWSHGQGQWFLMMWFKCRIVAQIQTAEKQEFIIANPSDVAGFGPCSLLKSREYMKDFIENVQVIQCG